MTRDIRLCNGCDHLRMYCNSELVCTAWLDDPVAVAKYDSDSIYRRVDDLDAELFAARPHISKRFEENDVPDECDSALYRLREL